MDAIRKLRNGEKDVFNAFMTRNAKRCGKYEIPYCPTTLEQLPENTIRYDNTKNAARPNALVHFYVDDWKFDGLYGIWNKPLKALDRLKNFGGVITPDFSLYSNMTKAQQIWQIFRMRAFGFWLTENGIPVVNNVRWNDPSTFDFAFDGLPENSILAVSTHGNLKQKQFHPYNEEGLAEMVRRLSPHTIIVFGSAPEKLFGQYRDNGINIKVYEPDVCLVHDIRKRKK